VVCTGYDRTDSTFSFMNSWGQHWGYRGHFKATEERLEQACGFAYILANDSTADWPTAPGEPADDDHLTGAHVREEFKPGEFQQINGKKVQLASLHPKGHEGVVQLFDTRTLMFTCPTSPLLSMRLAVFTVSPQMSYWNFFTKNIPRCPPPTGPVWMPDAHLEMRASPAARCSSRRRRLAFYHEVLHLQGAMHHNAATLSGVRGRAVHRRHVGIADGLDLLDAVPSMMPSKALEARDQISPPTPAH
jgi:hypothetical protein